MYNIDMKIKMILAVLLTLAAAGCATAPRTLVGNDRDAHGCIGSAGYAWSEVLQQCARPWEHPEGFPAAPGAAD